MVYYSAAAFFSWCSDGKNKSAEEKLSRRKSSLFFSLSLPQPLTKEKKGKKERERIFSLCFKNKKNKNSPRARLYSWLFSIANTFAGCAVLSLRRLRRRRRALAARYGAFEAKKKKKKERFFSLFFSSFFVFHRFCCFDFVGCVPMHGTLGRSHVDVVGAYVLCMNCRAK